MASVLAEYSIEAMHSDEFIVNLWSESPDAVLEAVRGQRANPQKSAEVLLAMLEKCGLSETVARMRAQSSEK
ncbi:hypothetical protein [Singulisphaera sp. GP187]|uniref:hypothetical protein n=1 Tax=Singulisphaera sp. GP187 TaxID=1882752 RepID=UPI0013565508|nr:hypothetical protein [Singulisphaera sp. GP187]